MVKRQSARSVVRNGSRPEPITTVTTIDKALSGEIYRVLGRSTAIGIFAELGLPFPAELPAITSETQFPIKIGDVEDRALGDLQSFWGAQFARSNALLSLARAEAKRLDRVTKRQEKIIFRQYAPSNPRSTLVDKVWGDVYAHTRLAQLEKKLDAAEALETVLEGLTKDFATYLDIIRSELMWRMSERRATREN